MVAVWVQLVSNVLNGFCLRATLILINGTIIALVATKGAEMLKSKKQNGGGG